LAKRTLTKQEVAERIKEAHGGITRSEARAIVDEILEVLADGLGQDGVVKVRGFGTFKLRARQPRVCRHPRTGEPIKVREATVVSFKQSEKLFAR